MRHATPELHELARRLLAHETDSTRPSDAAAVMRRACERLSAQIDPLIGAGGMRALFVRALHLAQREFRWLETVEVGEAAVCSFEHLGEAVGERPADDAQRGTAAILANIIWLLVTFIGDDLALGLVRQAWSEVPLGGAAAANEGTNV